MPYRNCRGESGTKNDSNWYFVQNQKNGRKIDPQVHRKKPPPREGFVFTMFPDQEPCVRERFHDEMWPSYLVVKSLTHGSWWGNIVNTKPPRGRGFLSIKVSNLKSREFLFRARGGRFNFLLTPMGGWVGVKPAARGVFLEQSGRFWVVQKFIYLNLQSNIWILAPHIRVLAVYIWIWRQIFEFRAIYLNFGATNLKLSLFEGFWGGVGGSPRTSGRFGYRCREKIFRPPLVFEGFRSTLKIFLSFDNLIVKILPPRGVSLFCLGSPNKEHPPGGELLTIQLGKACENNNSHQSKKLFRTSCRVTWRWHTVHRWPIYVWVLNRRGTPRMAKITKNKLYASKLFHV